MLSNYSVGRPKHEKIMLNTQLDDKMFIGAAAVSIFAFKVVILIEVYRRNIKD